MENRQIISEVKRIKNLMNLNEDIGALIRGLMKNVDVVGRITARSFTDIRLTLDDLIRQFNDDGRYVPSIQATETIPEYMIRIAQEGSGVADDVLEEFYKIFPRLSDEFAEAAKTKVPDIIGDVTNTTLRNDLAILSRSEVDDFLRRVLGLTDEVKIKGILDDIDGVRLKMPIKTAQEIKIEGLKKWFGLGNTKTAYLKVADDVSTEVADFMKAFFKQSEYKDVYKVIDAKKGIQQYVTGEAEALQLAINSGEVTSKSQALNFLKTRALAKGEELKKIIPSDMWQYIIPKFPTKINDAGKEVLDLTLINMLKWQSTLTWKLFGAYYLTQIDDLWRATKKCQYETYKEKMKTPDLSVDDFEKAWNSMSDTDKDPIENACYEDMMFTFLGGLVKVFGGPFVLIITQGLKGLSGRDFLTTKSFQELKPKENTTSTVTYEDKVESFIEYAKTDSMLKDLKLETKNVKEGTNANNKKTYSVIGKSPNGQDVEYTYMFDGTSFSPI